jgi:3-deoxy-manno-octulosonate cytidylyltransferase (CMP-KDO synthetase)
LPRQRGWASDDIVINLQGDEPLAPPEVINQLIQGMVDRPEIPMATLSEPLEQAKDFFDPNVVKVLANDEGLAVDVLKSAATFPKG